MDRGEEGAVEDAWRYFSFAKEAFERPLQLIVAKKPKPAFAFRKDKRDRPRMFTHIGL